LGLRARTALFILAAAAAMVAGPAQAQPTIGHAPWCVVMGSQGGWLDCAYYTLEQCMATASGVSNGCTRNSWYVPEPPPPRARKRYPPR
jgi:hypothetical protein